MILKKFLQRIPFLLVVGSLDSATASSLLEWEGSLDEGRSEDGAPRGLVDERAQPVEEQSTEVTEVAASPKRQNFVSKPNKDLAMVPVRSKGEIVDETSTTGENAKKKLPSNLIENPPSHPSILQDINLVTTNLITMDSLEKAE